MFEVVSIHASVKDATTSRPDNFIALSVSIYASVKDATKRFFAIPPGLGFNPRICKRCDVSACQYIDAQQFQSTHL